MSYHFDKTVSTNYMRIGSSHGLLKNRCGGAPALSLFARVWPTTAVSTAAATDNAILVGRITGTSNGLQINLDATGGTSAIKNRILGRSLTTDAAQSRIGTATFAAETWNSVGGVLDFPNDLMTPYTNGASDNPGTVTFGGSSFSSAGTPTDYDTLSSVASTAASHAGSRLADVAVWTVDIGAAAYAALHAGVCPLDIRRDKLVAYWPLLRSMVCPVDHTLDGALQGSADHYPHPAVRFPL